MALPPAPNPNQDASTRPHDYNDSGVEQTNEPMILQDENWDLYSVSGIAAVQMLAQVLQQLSHITGDVACSPRPMNKSSTLHTAPTSNPDGLTAHSPGEGSDAQSPNMVMSPSLTPHHCVPAVPIGSPEAQRDEPMPAPIEHADAEAEAVQHAAVSRRFFLKSPPPFTITDYLLRLHKFSPHSPGVYLAAAAYIHRLCVVETLLPATPRTVHRLSLAAIRIASKTLEDNKWTQERIARLGGVSPQELRKLEISFCYLLDFDLFLRPEDLKRSMWLLQSTARQGLAMRRRLSEGFTMRLPPRLLPEAAIGA